MMMVRDRRGNAFVWAVIGGGVLVAGIIVTVATAVGSRQPDTTATPPVSPDPAAEPQPTTPEPPSSPRDDVIDASVAERGWVPEPITTDAEVYVRAVLAAASTFDTTLSSRDEWLDHLDTWFTPDTRYDESDRAARMIAAQLELRQSIVFPQEMWDSIERQDGRVVSSAVGEITFDAVPEDDSGQMSIATADVELTFTQTDGTGTESSYTEDARVSVQVLCGEGSLPTPGTAQQAGDCKLVRFFPEPLES